MTPSDTCPNRNSFENRPAIGWYTTRLSPETSADITGLCAALGRSFDELVTSGRFDHLELQKGPNGEAELCLGEHRYTAVEWLARLLKNVAITLESRTGYDEHTYILLHSASLDLYQQSCLKVAAERAGLKVVRLVRHSVAAALGLGWTYHKIERARAYANCSRLGNEASAVKYLTACWSLIRGLHAQRLQYWKCVMKSSRYERCQRPRLWNCSLRQTVCSAPTSNGRLSSNADGQPAQKCLRQFL